MDLFLKHLRNIQVVISALVAGLIFLVAVMLFMVFQVKPGGFIAGIAPQFAGFPLMTTVMVGVSLLILLISFVLPPWALNQQLAHWAKGKKPIEMQHLSWETSDRSWLNNVPSADLEQLLTIFQANRVLAVTLGEAAGITSSVVFLLEAHPVALTMIILSIASMLWRFPTQNGLNQWLVQQLERLSRDRTSIPVDRV